MKRKIRLVSILYFYNLFAFGQINNIELDCSTKNKCKDCLKTHGYYWTYFDYNSLQSHYECMFFLNDSIIFNIVYFTPEKKLSLLYLDSVVLSLAQLEPDFRNYELYRIKKDKLYFRMFNDDTTFFDFKAICYQTCFIMVYTQWMDGKGNRRSIYKVNNIFKYRYLEKLPEFNVDMTKFSKGMFQKFSTFKGRKYNDPFSSRRPQIRSN